MNGVRCLPSAQLEAMLSVQDNGGAFAPRPIVAPLGRSENRTSLSAPKVRGSGRLGARGAADARLARYLGRHSSRDDDIARRTRLISLVSLQDAIGRQCPVA